MNKFFFVGFLVCVGSLFAAESSFKRPLVSLTFDDGWQSQYDNAVPVLQEYGFPATFYIYTQVIGLPGQFSKEEIQSLKAKGHEIGAHSVTHPHLSRLDEAAVEKEVSESKKTLELITGGPVNNFAAPYGDVNAMVIKVIGKYFKSNRSVVAGYNTPANLDKYKIRSFAMTPTVTEKMVDLWLDKAVQDKAWIVFTYHQDNVQGGSVSTRPEMFKSQMEAIKKRNLTVLTVEQALNEVLSQ